MMSQVAGKCQFITSGTRSYFWGPSTIIVMVAVNRANVLPGRLNSYRGRKAGPTTNLLFALLVGPDQVRPTGPK
jgi:hypothetical protein